MEELKTLMTAIEMQTLMTAIEMSDQAAAMIRNNQKAITECLKDLAMRVRELEDRLYTEKRFI